MRRILLNIIVLSSLFSLNIYSQEVNPWAVDLARAMSYDIFDLNGIPYLEPMVKAVNATSNARFYNTAYVPAKVDKPYFKVSINGMFGFVPDDMKSYSPSIPMEKYSPTGMTDYVSYDFNTNKFVINDTAGLVYYFFKNLLYDGVTQNSIPLPESAATILGYQDTKFIISTDTLIKLAQNHPIWPLIPASLQDSVLKTLSAIPTFYSFPPGADMNSIFAFVPQVEIGSLFGTEVLLRFIPPIDMGEEIGDFAFWGIGLKHSISQYFGDRIFDLAIQGVYQGTWLKNTVGVTNSELEANTQIYNVNIHASKAFEGILDIFTGVSYDFINTTSSFKFYLPVETQYFLGLLPAEKDENGNVIRILPPDPPEYPGDTEPQSASIQIQDYSWKWVIGLAKDIGPIRLYVDYSISKFDIFSGGIEYKF